MLHLHRTLALAVALCLASLAHAGNVLVVDALHPPSTFADVPSALAAAVDGDAVLIRTGTYARFDVPNKELSIVADQGALVDIVGAVQLQQLSATRTLFLAGLRVTGAYGIGSVPASGLLLTNAAGSVRIEDCSFRAAPGTADFCTARPGVQFSSCPDVAMTRCFVRGQDAASFSFARGGVGLTAIASRVALYECTVEGGQGGWCDFCDPYTANDNNCNYGYTIAGDGADGGAGCRLMGSELFLSASVIRGGDGGIARNLGSFAYYGGCGGHGLLATGATAIYGLETTPAGGQGSASVGSAPPGAPGAPVSPNPALFVPLSGFARRLSGPRVVRDTGVLPLHLEGLFDDRVGLFLTVRTNHVLDLPFHGVHLTPTLPFARFLRIGSIDPNGVLDIALPLTVLGPGDLGRTFHFQALHRDAQGGYTLGPGWSVLVVDAAL